MVSPAIFAPNRTTLRAMLAVFIMALGVVAIYWPPPAQPNSVLIGSDYLQLHSRRMQFARDAIITSAQLLPAWYPRELLGTPFWSNIQNFPFIPTRLLVLLTMEPNGQYTYAIAVSLSAVLAALFTYLYTRKVGLGLTGSAAAGWTFACSGYYASRVTAGHLPMLEAYPALPLLLWLVECQLQKHEQHESPRRWICAVALGTTSVILAGHPQLPVYSIIVAALYALWRGGSGRTVWSWTAMVLGIGIAGFVLFPMAMLIARSSRVLALARAFNDLSMPYGRLAAFFFPWLDGAPPLLDHTGAKPFRGYPDMTYFWDTVVYTGVLPWIALVLICSYFFRCKLDRFAMKIAIFTATMGVLGILLAVPLVQQLTTLIPGTIFRSPARLIYLTVFALSLALGVGLHLVLSIVRPGMSHALVALFLVVHIVDLGGHDRLFILRGSLLPTAESESFTNILKNVGNGRAALDYELTLPVNRTVDDVGFFDSIMLARSYKAMLSLAGAPFGLNIQNFNGSELSPRALTATGVKVMFTRARRMDLRSEGEIHGIRVYSNPGSSERAEFFEMSQVRYLPTEQIHDALRDPKFDLQSRLLLPLDATLLSWTSSVIGSKDDAAVEYRRPTSDQIECTVTTGRSGYLRIIESWDPGWSATIDGEPVQIVPALDAMLAVPVTPGRHEVRFVYRTPGVAAGATISIMSLGLLAALMWISERSRHGQS